MGQEPRDWTYGESGEIHGVSLRDQGESATRVQSEKAHFADYVRNGVCGEGGEPRQYAMVAVLRCNRAVEDAALEGGRHKRPEGAGPGLASCRRPDNSQRYVADLRKYEGNRKAGRQEVSCRRSVRTQSAAGSLSLAEGVSKCRMLETNWLRVPPRWPRTRCLRPV